MESNLYEYLGKCLQEGKWILDPIEEPVTEDNYTLEVALEGDFEREFPLNRPKKKNVMLEFFFRNGLVKA